MTKDADRRIYVFGNPDKSELGFPMPGDLKKYLRHDVFAVEGGRYRYTLPRNADVIVMSRDGLAYGHLYIDQRVKPNDADREAYPRVRWVYLVRKSALYDKPVLLSDLSIKVGQFGKNISEDEFKQLQDLAGEVTESQGGTLLPESAIELERVLREVRQRLGQTDFRASLISAYSGKCAFTDCDAVDALEAAHITPYSDTESNDPSNGLLLRADIHMLFDRQLLGIDPADLKVHVAPPLVGTCYEELSGRTVAKPKKKKCHPKEEALKKRWKKFSAQHWK